MHPLVALVCSVDAEADPLARRMSDASELVIGRRRAREGRIAGVPALLVTGGMGKANAAQALGVVLELRHVRAAIGFGVAGAYADGGLAVGEVALASSEIYADEGVETPAGWISTREIGIPLVAGADGGLFNEIPCDAGLLRRAATALDAAGVRHAVGPFATVSCCSGTRGRGVEVAARTAAICESMEGAAYAHVATLYGVPFLEVRGVSNLVVDRDPAAWRIADAAEAAAAALELAIPSL